MRIRYLALGALIAGWVGVTGSIAAQADPLVPLEAAESNYIAQLRPLLTASGDREAFKSDAELLERGRSACARRQASGLIGFQGTFISPIITQLAFVYLCP